MKKNIGQIGGVILSVYFYVVLWSFAYAYFHGIVNVKIPIVILLSSISGVFSFCFLKSESLKIFYRELIQLIISSLIVYMILIPTYLLFTGAVWATNAILIILVFNCLNFMAIFIGVIIAGYISKLKQSKS